jgi:trigger factor
MVEEELAAGQSDEQTAPEGKEPGSEKAEERSSPDASGQAEQMKAEQDSEQAEQESRTAKNIVTIEEAGPCKKKITIEIPEETIKQATDERYDELRKEALVPGFRRGRAPRRLLEKRFGKETSEQIKLTLLAEASEAAIEDKEIRTLGEPDIDFEKIEMPAEGSMKFDFEVEVRPEFDLPKLEGIALSRTRLEVTDEQVDREIEQMRRLSGVWTPRKDEAIQLNDQVIADVVLKAEDVEEEVKLDEIEVYVRESGFVGGIPVEKLGELLVGAEAGKTRQTTVEVPKTYFREEYRGKKVDISIDIKDIKFLRPAELDENFLRRFEAEDEDELREKTRDALQGRLEQLTRTEMTEQIHKYLVENTDFELPLDVVAAQAETVLRRQYTNLLLRGLTREQTEEQMEQLQASSEEQAREQLKAFFIMDKVADELGIEVSEEEINGHIAQLAVQRGQRPERLREQMARDGSLAQFSVEVRENKCVVKLLESAAITEVEPKKKSKKSAKKAAEKAGGPAKKRPKKKSEAKKKTQG